MAIMKKILLLATFATLPLYAVHEKTLEQLEQQASLNSQLLIATSHFRSLDHIKDLVRQGADVNTADRWGRTPLHLAYQTSDIVAFLLSVGADPNCQDRNGQTPLHFAVENRWLFTIQVLIPVTNLSLQNSFGKKALETGNIALLFVKAVEDKFFTFAKIILEKNRSFNVNYYLASGMTPLHQLALMNVTIPDFPREEYISLARQLVSDERVDLNALNNAGRTAREVAALAGNAVMTSIFNELMFKRKMISYCLRTKKHMPTDLLPMIWPHITLD